jgi:aminoglycoside/choline kinase family phosphotransferase
LLRGLIARKMKGKKHSAINPRLVAFIESWLREEGRLFEGFEAQRLPGDGSERTFWRISVSPSERSVIAMENRPVRDFSRRENLAYLRIGKHLSDKGLPLPKIYRHDLDRGWFIMEDLGDTNLQDVASGQKNRHTLYEKITEILIRLQIEGSEGFDPAWTCQTETYDRVVMRRYESDYFKNAFLGDYLGLKNDLPELERCFDHLADTASKAESRFFLHRDFQSRNIIISGGRIGILDWQGGRMGPLAYDLASLLIDPYIGLSADEKNHVYENYLGLVREQEPRWVYSVENYFPYLAIQRNLQILGAFSFLSKEKGKTYFEAYMPPALRSLISLLEELNDRRLSPLQHLCRSLPELK